MNLLSSVLTFALVADTTPAGASCTRGDHACQAAMYTARAEAATTPAARAKYHEAAHRSFLALYDQTRDHEALCAARRSLERTARVLGPKAAAQQLAPLRHKLAEREAAAHPNCAVARARPAKNQKTLTRHEPRHSPTEFSSHTQPAPATQEPVEPTAQEPAEPTAAVATSAPLQAMHGPAATPTPTPEPNVLLAVPAHRAAPRPQYDRATPADPTARRLLIVGGVTIGVGVGLAVVAGYAGGQLAHASRDSFDLYADNQGRGDAAALAQEDALRQTYTRWLPVTVTTAALGGTAVVMGAILVAVGKRRMAISSRAAVLPIPGGLAIRARF